MRFTHAWRGMRCRAAAPAGTRGRPFSFNPRFPHRGTEGGTKHGPVAQRPAACSLLAPNPPQCFWGVRCELAGLDGRPLPGAWMPRVSAAETAAGVPCTRGTPAAVAARIGCPGGRHWSCGRDNASGGVPCLSYRSDLLGVQLYGDWWQRRCAGGSSCVVRVVRYTGLVGALSALSADVGARCACAVGRDTRPRRSNPGA
jgi:hypothetical protein